MPGETTLFAARGGFLYRWEPRHKLLGLCALIFAFAVVRDLRLLPAILVTALCIYCLSALPLSFLASRMRLPGLYLLAMGLILPFGSGQTILARLGPLSLRLEGSASLLLIAVKFFCIITVGAVLFASTPLPDLAKAMRSVGVPSLLAEMLLFTHRYIFQLTGDLQRTRAAACVRGFQGKSLLSVKTLAYIVGSLLVRSHAQAERVYQAMTLRGYGCGTAPASGARPGPGDRLALAAGVLLAAAFVLTQALLLP